MSTNSSSNRNGLSDSTATIPSDSENYSPSSNSEPSHLNPSDSESPPSSSSPIILYSPPTFWSLLRGAGINLILPFVNGLMLGLGELLAHEAAFRLGWSGTKVFPSGRSSRTVGPGVEMRSSPMERRRRDDEADLMDTASLE